MCTNKVIEWSALSQESGDYLIQRQGDLQADPSQTLLQAKTDLGLPTFLVKQSILVPLW
jgi:hypothetical protein